MRKSDVPLSTQQSFVVTAVFMTQRTVTAKSVSEALDLAHDTLVVEGATSENLVNWFAHPIE